MARDIVKFYYKDALEPSIEFCHNSDQRDQVIADNVKSLVGDTLFIQGPPDVNVSSSCMNEPH